MQKNTIIFLASKTGGPLLPLIPIAKILQTKYKILFFGVRKGFEVSFLKDYPYQLEFLLEAKYNAGSFLDSPFFIRFFGNFFVSLWDFIKLFLNLVLSFYKLLKIKPTAIISAGSFLNIPVILASKILNFSGLTRIKIILHQQDPKPGISNAVFAGKVDMLSCVFEYTKENFASFKKAKIIPNPIDPNRFTKAKIQALNLQTFLDRKSLKPILLIFGGGSGAEFLNLWTQQYFSVLIKNFRVILLTGQLQTKTFNFPKHPDFWTTKSLNKDMPAVLIAADLVLARAGLSTISELEMLDKTAFLVPMPNSHQELNAKLVSHKFPTLEQKNANQWLDIILKTKISKKNKPEFEIDPRLENYYQELLTLLEK